MCSFAGREGQYHTRDLTSEVKFSRPPETPREAHPCSATMWRFDSLRVSKRLSEQEEAMASVQRRLTALEVQWTDTLDRLKSMMGRLIKERSRTERAAEQISPEGREANLSDEDVAAGAVQVPGWSPRQQEAQNRILARRNRQMRQEQ